MNDRGKKLSRVEAELADDRRIQRLSRRLNLNGEIEEAEDELAAAHGTEQELSERLRESDPEAHRALEIGDRMRRRVRFMLQYLVCGLVVALLPVWVPWLFGELDKPLSPVLGTASMVIGSLLVLIAIVLSLMVVRDDLWLRKHEASR